MKQLMIKILLVCVLLTVSCTYTVEEESHVRRFASGKPVLHGTLGARLMIISKGTMIGDIPAPDNGVFMTAEIWEQLIEDALKNKTPEFEM